MYIGKAVKIDLKQESPYYTVKAYARAARMLGSSYSLGSALCLLRRAEPFRALLF